MAFVRSIGLEWMFPITNTMLRGFLASDAENFYIKTVDDILPFQPQKWA